MGWKRLDRPALDVSWRRRREERGARRGQCRRGWRGLMAGMTVLHGECPPRERQARLTRTWNPWESPAGRIPSPRPVSGREIRCRTRPQRRGTCPRGLSASACAMANSVGLKNEVLPDYLWAFDRQSERLIRVAHRVGRAFVAGDARPPPWTTLHREWKASARRAGLQPVLWPDECAAAESRMNRFSFRQVASSESCSDSVVRGHMSGPPSPSMSCRRAASTCSRASSSSP